jgi:membrane protein implicated in regulation of membrane protease activity
VVCVLAAFADEGDPMTWKTWLIVSAVCLIIEILPPPTHFGALCLAFGALSAAIAAYFTDIAWIPWTVFSIVSIALIPVLIPLAKFMFKPKPHASNVDALIGERAVVIEPISPQASGLVKVKGESWRARSEDESFNKDQWVDIVKIEGTHVVVRRVS